MKPAPLKNLRILPSMHQRFLERDTSDVSVFDARDGVELTIIQSQEPFGGEQSPCTPTDALQIVFKVILFEYLVYLQFLDTKGLSSNTNQNTQLHKDKISQKEG